MKKALSTIALAATTSVTLVACSDAGSQDPAADTNQINIVASTAIWGDIAEGLTEDMDNVQVTTILDNNRDDPHSYEASAKDLANLTTADIVVANGGGYDNWLTDKVREETPIVTAVPLAEGHEHGGHGDEGHGDEGHEHGGANPHVWFTMATVDSFVENLAQQLNELSASEAKDSQPADPSDVEATTAEFTERFTKLKDSRVVLTEPVAEGIIDQSDLQDVTPDGYADSVSKEAEPSASDIAATQKLIEDGKVDVLITNEQSHSSAASTLIQAAKDNDVPIVNVNETPDTDQDYFDYVDGVISELEEAQE